MRFAQSCSTTIIRTLLATAIVLVPLACDRQQSPTTRPAPIVKIGAVLARSGPAAEIGEPEAKTLEMAVAATNADPTWTGPKLTLSILDSGGDPARAKSHVETLMSSGCAAVIGPSTSGESLAARPLAGEYKVPLISLAASHKIIEGEADWVFKTAQSDSLAVQVVCEDLKRRNLSTIALAYAADQFGQSGAEEWRRWSSQTGISIRQEVTFERQDTNLAAPIAKLLQTQPAAIVIWGTGPGPAEATRAVRAAKFAGSVYLSHGSASRKYIELAGDAANGVRLPASKILVLDLIPPTDPQHAELMRYAAAFKKAYPNQDPSHFGGHAWDAFQLIKRALQSGAQSPLEVQAALLKSGSYPGVTGVFNWVPSDHEGLGPSSFVLIEIVDGKWTVVAP